MAPHPLRFRQIHLDFHTSEHIPGVGDDFDPEEFVQTLKKAHVDSITCFARCHHGWIYYDTQAHRERRHPRLSRNLLKEQIQACHAHGIRVPVYTSIQWDHYTANAHPEWLVLDEKGAPRGTPLYEPGFYRYLCVNSPYRDFLKTHVRELAESLPIDGFFFDIVQPQDCSCRYCREAMEEEGLDPTQAAHRRLFGLRTINEFKREMSQLVRKLLPEASIFYNAGHIGPRHREAAEAYTHFEIESLPSGGWGYLHFPIAMRYARTLGLECLGHTGKFHTTWGDFHSLKNRAALEYECFRMLALGSKCLIGDQLHPRGRIDPHVYDLIGSVYAQVEEKEPWCRGARPVVEIGVMTPEAFATPDKEPERLLPAMRGITRMLEEGAYQFDVIDPQADFSRYRVLVLPDTIPVKDELAARIDEFVRGGGALIASYRSGLRPDGTGFALESLGVKWVGEAPFSPDFVLPKGEIGKGLPPTEHVMYRRGAEVRPLPGARVLAEVIIPYFNRTYKHFTSHRHTPSSGEPAYPGIVQNGRSIYFAHPLFAQYDENAPRWCKQLFLNALEMLVTQPLIRHDGPSTLQVYLTEQPAHGRWIVHALHYIPERRSRNLDVVEDVIPLHDVRFSMRAPGRIKTVRCVPQGRELAFDQREGRVEWVLSRLEGHQMVEITPIGSSRAWPPRPFKT